MQSIQPRRTRRRFAVRLEYYDRKGRCQYRGSFEADFYCDDHGNPFMSHVAAKVRGWRNCGAPESLPGLPSEYDHWDGPIRVECEGAARLVMPE